MAHDRLEVLAGAAVLAIGVGFALFASREAGMGAQTGSYPLTASFRALDGVSVGSEVRLAGVDVGRITAITLNPETYMADVVVEIDTKIQLPDDTAILVSSEGLLGGNYVELLPGGSPDFLQPGDEIEDTQGSVSLVSLLMKFVSGSDGEAAAAP